MRDFFAGLFLVLVGLGLQTFPGAARSADWVSLWLFWFCLWADPRAGVAVAWSSVWLMEIESAAPGGMHGIVLALTAFAAVCAREWVRRESTVAALLFVGFFTALALAAQALWLAAIGAADLADLRPRVWEAMTKSSLAALVSVPLLQRGVGPFLGKAEPFAP